MKRRFASLIFLTLMFASELEADHIGFDIVVQHENPLTQAERLAFESAEATWESIILGYQESPPIESLIISSRIVEGDGPGGVLGSARPTQLTAESPFADFLYARAGEMSFDSSDTATLAAAGVLDDLILHEMGHVIGLGTLWSGSAIGIPGFQELYTSGSGQYTGTQALAAYRREFDPNATYVPVELDGGPGTANSHWNEEDLGDEVMTGFIHGEVFVSGVTIGGLEDLGYLVTPEPSSLAQLAGLALTLFAVRHRRRTTATLR
ncbi:MAG: leishmanolysin-related zinc metalloendopeptidase [Planctomycetota bacterium]